MISSVLVIYITSLLMISLVSGAWLSRDSTQIFTASFTCFVAAIEGLIIFIHRMAPEDLAASH